MSCTSRKPRSRPNSAASSDAVVDVASNGESHRSASALAVGQSSEYLQQQALALGLPPGTFLSPAAEPIAFDDLGTCVLMGQGEFCSVMKGELRGRTQVAIKSLKPKCEVSVTAIGDLRREIWTLSKMSHPNILGFVGHGVKPSGGIPFGCFILFDHTLSRDLPKPSTSSAAFATPWKPPKASREWPLERGLSIGVQIARAMRYCHDEFMPGFRLLHRDLKPDNIGVAADGRAILADFGLCKLWKKSMGSGEELEMRSLTGLTGSLRYMAPEVALSQPYNHKAEVFSFTSLLYHLLASQKPFAWMTPEVFLAEACRGSKRCPFGKGWPAQVREIIAAGWRADPAVRPEFRQLVPALEKALAGGEPDVKHL